MSSCNLFFKGTEFRIKSVILSFHWNCIHFCKYSASAINTVKLIRVYDVIKWKHFPRYWPFCAGNLPVTGEFPSRRPVTPKRWGFLCTWTNGWKNNRDAGDLRHHRAHYDVIVMVAFPHRQKYFFHNSTKRFTSIFSCGKQHYKYTMSVCLSVRLSVRLSVCPSIYPL